MGNQVILFSLLLLTASCWSDLVLTTIIFRSKGSWGEVQRSCRQSYTSMVTWININSLSRTGTAENRTRIWVGLQRNTANDSQWNWINQTVDVSRSIRWDLGQSSSHCAYVEADEHRRWTWFSGLCSRHDYFFCSKGTNITFYPLLKTWYEAQEFCQEEGGHLVTFNKHDKADLNKRGWIGLYRVGGNTWRWVGNESSGYRTWAYGEPSTRDCGLLNTKTKRYESKHCSEAHGHVCIHDNLVLVKLNRTWEEALEFCSHTCTTVCRSYLFRIKTVSMHLYVRQRIQEATTDQVWTGRRFLGGRWFPEVGNLVDEPWISSQCPAHHCGVMSKSDPSMLLSRDCTEKRNFICSRVQT